MDSPFATGGNFVDDKQGAWCEFPFKERKHYSSHPAANQHFADGMTPAEEEPLNPNYGHIDRSRRDHDGHSLASGPPGHQFVQSGPNTPQSATGGSDQWQTSAQAMNGGKDDEFGPKKYRRAKKAVQPSLERDGYGTGSLFGVMRHGQLRIPGTQQNDVEAGTWKATGHVPGYSGHLPRNAQTTGAPFMPGKEPRSLDKSLLKENYHVSMPGCTKKMPGPI